MLTTLKFLLNTFTLPLVYGNHTCLLHILIYVVSYITTNFNFQELRCCGDLFHHFHFHLIHLKCPLLAELKFMQMSMLIGRMNIGTMNHTLSTGGLYYFIIFYYYSWILYYYFIVQGNIVVVVPKLFPNLAILFPFRILLIF